MKFVHVTIAPIGSLEKYKIAKTGYFCWHRAFGAKPMQHVFARGTLSEYDIILVVISKAELDGMLISEIRKEVGFGNDAPKIIACPDYAIQLWQTGYLPRVLEFELKQADMVFVPCENMIGRLESIAHRKIYVIDHPVDIEGLSKIEPSQPNTAVPIVSLVHRYDYNWYDPWLATKDLPWPAGAMLMTREVALTASPYFEIKFPEMKYDDFLPWMKSRKVMVDSYHFVNAWGRMQVECAVLGVPCVGTSAVKTQKDLWPGLTTAPADTYSQGRLIYKLMTDEEFRKDQLTFAAQRVNGYGFADRKRHLLKVLNEETGYEENKEERAETPETPAEGTEGDDCRAVSQECEVKAG